MTDMRPFPRRPADANPLPAAPLLPIPAAAGKTLFVGGLLGPDPDTLAPRPRTRDFVHKVVSKILLPVMLQDLAFLGLDDPDIRIIANWMPESDSPAAANLPPLVTQGRVCISAFATVFALLCRAAGASTTAHRRYKGAFAGERIHIVIHADSNSMKMYMSTDLRDALNDGYTCWAQGR